MSWCRMYGYTRLFVENQKVVIFIQYFEVDLYRLKSCLFLRRKVDLDVVSGFQSVMSFTVPAVEQYQALFMKVVLYA